MKKVLVHWIEMRTLEVPDECPTDDDDLFQHWLFEDCRNNPYCGSPFDYDDKNHVVDTGTRDFEIVDVEAIEPVKVGYFDDAVER